MQKKFSIWFLVLIGLIHAIWLISIPNGIQNAAVSPLSMARLFLLALILLPAALPLFFLITPFRLFLQRQQTWIVRITNGASSLVLISGFFFLLLPFNNFRYQMSPVIWQRLAPLVSCYILIALYWFVISKLTIKESPPGTQKTSNRETFVDLTRGFAILLAITSHAFFEFGYENIFGESQYLIKAITRFATPSFILITGLMFELVYLRKAQKHGMRRASLNLLSRAAQCYLFYLITVFVEWFGQMITTADALKATVFLANSIYSGILKFYVLFLVLAIVIIWLRKNFGIWFIAGLPLFLWTGEIFLQKIAWPQIGAPLSYLSSLLFGKPAFSNFSIWHAITFAAFGMVLGNFIKPKHQAANWRNFYLAMFVLLVINLLVTLFVVFPTPIEQVIYNFANNDRIQHNITYYSIGSMGALALLWFFWLIRNQLNHAWLENSVITLGKNSLWAFGVGNSLVVLLPAINDHPLTVTAFVAAVLGGSILIIHLKNHIIRINKLEPFNF